MPTPDPQLRTPMVVAVDMGYGHLRAARPLARLLGTELVHVDRPPLADAEEQRLWVRVRRAYEWTSRASQLPGLGRPFRWLLDSVTDIPHLYPLRDLSAPSQGALALERLVRRGLGRGLCQRLRETQAPLVTTFYSPAIAADRNGLDRVFCVVTDSDVNRVWAPLSPGRARVHYLAPSQRVVRRLRAYGVPPDCITFTGFPLPHELVGGPHLPALTRNLAARLVRLDPSGEFRSAFREELDHFLGPLPSGEEGRPPLLVFAVGGAGAQAELARHFLPSLRPAIEKGRLRLALVAGVRPEVAGRFQAALAEAGLEPAPEVVEILLSRDHDDYFDRFDALLAGADLLWTKPSELVFYAALGLPVVCAQPVGVHERYNRRWVTEAGAGFRQQGPGFAWQWISDWLEDGTLAAAAWSGFQRLPKFGTYRVLEAVGRPLDVPGAVSGSGFPPVAAAATMPR
ncbi:MAG TPA: hypothetical protein VFR85_17435 [Anaeromyxobacteraceae bacterium]|nr:hypothetical protein [Anaeromyxobacteraceae bacterium]